MGVMIVGEACLSGVAGVCALDEPVDRRRAAPFMEKRGRIALCIDQALHTVNRISWNI